MKRMNRRSFVQVAAFAPLAAATIPVSAASLWGSGDATRGPAMRRVGDDRFELTMRRVLEGDSPRFTEEFLLADVRPKAERRFTEFSGDLSGRYIGALAMAARVYGCDAPGLDSLVEKVISLQKADGYFGGAFHFDQPTDADMDLLWGNGRLLVGLLECYQWRPTEPVLTACRRIGDFLVRVSPMMLSKEIRDGFGAKHFASSYICWTQQTEGLAGLYKATKDERYRKLAEEIAAVIERRPGDHVHGYLTSLRGVMDLYHATKDASLLRQCETAWREITASRDLLITGGVPEGWSPNNHRTEGCAEADWVRLNLALWTATEDAKYLAMAERAIFNELAFNQFATGDFGHRVYTATGFPAAGAVRAWWCCTLHGLRCFPDIRENAFRQAKGWQLWLDLPVDGQIETSALSAVSESKLARDGTLRITITGAGSEPALLGVRKPEWAADWQIKLNGAPRSDFLDQPHASLNRVWSVGDVVDVKYGMKLRSEPNGTDREALWYGPWLLGASAADNPAYFNELTTENRLMGEGKSAAWATDQRQEAFSVPIARTDMEYAPAEFPQQPATVNLRPIAEQTGRPSTSWEVRFLTCKQS